MKKVISGKSEQNHIVRSSMSIPVASDENKSTDNTKDDNLGSRTVEFDNDTVRYLQPRTERSPLNENILNNGTLIARTSKSSFPQATKKLLKSSSQLFDLNFKFSLVRNQPYLILIY